MPAPGFCYVLPWKPSDSEAIPNQSRVPSMAAIITPFVKWLLKPWTEAIGALVFLFCFNYCLIGHWCMCGHLKHDQSNWNWVSEVAWGIAAVLLLDLYRRREKLRVRMTMLSLMGVNLLAFLYTVSIFHTRLSSLLGDSLTWNLFLLLCLGSIVISLIFLVVALRRVWSKGGFAANHRDHP